MTVEAGLSPLFMVLDPDGTIVRIVADEREFDAVRASHLVSRLDRELPREIGEPARQKLLVERAREIIPQYKMVLL